MEPGFDSEGFIKYQEGFANDTFNTLIDRIKELNQEIAKDKSLGKGFCIGHSYFCNTDECTEEWMQDVVDFDVLPMLAEYWFDDHRQKQHKSNILQRWNGWLFHLFSFSNKRPPSAFFSFHQLKITTKLMALIFLCKSRKM